VGCCAVVLWAGTNVSQGYRVMSGELNEEKTGNQNKKTNLTNRNINK
jgi:hypothetical protein